jgi:hypothetical protein
MCVKLVIYKNRTEMHGQHNMTFASVVNAGCVGIGSKRDEPFEATRKSLWESVLGSGHTESGLPRRAAISARGGKAFELCYVRLHHPRLLLDGDDAFLRNRVRKPSRRGGTSLPAAAARFLCGQTLTPSSVRTTNRTSLTDVSYQQR